MGSCHRSSGVTVVCVHSTPEEATPTVVGISKEHTGYKTAFRGRVAQSLLAVSRWVPHHYFVATLHSRDREHLGLFSSSFEFPIENEMLIIIINERFTSTSGSHTMLVLLYLAFSARVLLKII